MSDTDNIRCVRAISAGGWATEETAGEESEGDREAEPGEGGGGERREEDHRSLQCGGVGLVGGRGELLGGDGGAHRGQGAEGARAVEGTAGGGELDGPERLLGEPVGCTGGQLPSLYTRRVKGMLRRGWRRLL